MSIEKQLLERAGARCELCSSTSSLEVYDVAPNSGPDANTSVLLCQKCREHLGHPDAVEINHWYGLNESIWSEHPAVKVLCYRVLKNLEASPWANDLLDQIYLEEGDQNWANAGLKERSKSKAPVLDSNGTVLQDGDTVTLIKDLDVKGANFTAKRGTTVKNISLTDDPKYIEGKVNGTRIVLVAAYLKKA